mmetsp:Transcript_599/g.2105  ORF Transcript_599/g.2105 Transcript_599/m.2105 type:complete len:265 (+) Transcript_599:59-853(+)
MLMENAANFRDLLLLVMASLPNFTAVHRVHVRSNWAVPDVGECRKVLERPNDAVPGRAVHVGGHLALEVFVGGNFAPSLGKGDEPQLCVGVAWNDRLLVGVVAESFHIGVVGVLHSAHVGNVLVHCLRSVHVEAREDFVRVILVNDALQLLLEGKLSLWKPPASEPSNSVVVLSFVVISVCALVAHDHSCTTKVERPRYGGVVVRPLQNAGREEHCVPRGVVVCIDRGCAHLPSVTVGKMANSGGCGVEVVRLGCNDIAKVFGR